MRRLAAASRFVLSLSPVSSSAALESDIRILPCDRDGRSRATNLATKSDDFRRPNSSLERAFGGPSLRRFAAALAVVLLFVSYSFAQTTNASLTGFVSDPSKAMIPGATVIAVNTATDARFETKTDKGGSYFLPSLPAGPYRMQIEKPGFKTILKEDLDLHVQAALEVNFQMAIGSMSESITVTGSEGEIQSSGAVSTVIEHDFIENMPLNGNSLSTLFELTPGAVTNASGGNSAQGGGLSVNGQRATSNYLAVDGASENIYMPLATGVGSANITGQGVPVSASGGTNGLLPTDAVEEYRIQTSTYSAEYGRTPGGQIGVKTRGGTNEFHGAVFENFRNQVMDATDYMVKFLDEKQTPLRMNDFGGTFGGPILKNRLFFFGAHETLLMAQPQAGTSQDVPSTCAVTAAASSVQPLLSAFPHGNAGPDTKTALCNPTESESSTNQPYSDIYNAAFSQRVTDHSTSVRLDANLPWRTQAFFRINNAPSNQLTDSWHPSVSSTNIWATTVGATSQITPHFVNDLTINYSTISATLTNSLASYDESNPSTFTNAVAAIANPTTDEYAFYSYMWGGEPTIGPAQHNSIKQWNALDSVSWAMGRHSLKLGVDYLWRNPTLKPYALYLSPIFTTFGAIQSGIVNTLNYDQYYSNPNIKLTNLSFYANDAWRISNRLTLNYGLRWDINPSPSASGPGLFAIQGDVTNPSAITQAPTGTPLYKTQYTNFAPRFGFAYALRNSPRFGTVLRGGTGLFFDTGTAASGAQAAAEGYPYKGNGALTNVPYSSINWKGLVSSTPSLPQSALYITDPNLKAPRTYQWSVTLEQNLGVDSTLSASYVANSGQELANTVQYYTGGNFGVPVYFQNPMLEANSSFELLTNGAASSYQSLQTQVRSHLHQRLDLITSWTWSHNITNGDSDFSGPESIAEYNARANSSNDIRHIFSAAIHYNPEGFRSNRLLGAISEGWGIDTIALLQTASPVSVTAQNAALVQNQYNGLANVVPDVPVIVHDPTAPGGKRLNSNAFSVPTCACNGNSQENGYRLFGLTQWDLAASRTWALWERSSFSFRVDAFNILNIANFADVNNTIASWNLRTFGEAQKTYAGQFGSEQGALNTVFQNGGARSIQLSAKIKF